MPKLLSLLAAAACAPCALGQTTDVLFIGNSYTARNDLPALFEGLCAAGGHAVSTDRSTPGGNSLGAPQSNGSNHASNPVTLGLIASRSGDVVVLQEQSTIPTIPYGLANWMTPGAQTLANAAIASSADVRVVMYETWGRRDGGQFTWAGRTSPFFPDFDAMQTALTAGYESCGNAIGAEIAPVGQAWRRARQSFPSIELFAVDGSHPSPAGSYLAACVFYGRIIGESPSGLGFTGSLTASDANVLQDVANLIVFGQIGTRYCGPAVPNSTLVAGRMDVLGSARALDRSVRLRAPRRRRVRRAVAHGARQAAGRRFCEGASRAHRRPAPGVGGRGAGQGQTVSEGNQGHDDPVSASWFGPADGASVRWSGAGPL